MKANEFRYGNIVMVDNPKYHPQLKDVPLRVIGVEETIFDAKKDFSIRLEDMRGRETYAQLIRFVKPIALTRKRIEEIGFKEAGDAHLLKPYGLYVWCRTEHEDAWISEIDDVDVDKRDIWYLHKFQNTFFALTNKELEIAL